MKKYYTVEEINNCDDYELYEKYEDVLKLYSKILHDEANYNYNLNKGHIYNLEEVEKDEDDNLEFCTLKSISIEEFKNLDIEDKEKFLYEK